ncbi:MAG: two-component system, OmpR family, phosphate regulon response regulator PhoB [Chloroflexota bacterium]|jgi:DNA-binding response OmpR family regulator|nr:two-component system, OmpR family, phosphate regulon response regulator PhoB [Chloroflexota bacterium]
MSGARARLVLIVEDDKPTADVLASAINAERGYAAVQVGSADAALTAMAKISPDLLLLDIHLPGMSGLELYDQVKADERFRTLPVVFETGGGREHVAELRERGIATYVRKPFDIEELVRFVKRLVPPRNRHPKAGGG